MLLTKTQQPVADSSGCTISGVRIGAFTLESLVERLIDHAESPGRHVAVGVNAHVTNLCRRDHQLREQLQHTLNYADGQSVVWASRLLGHQLPERIATTDLAEPLLRAAAARGLPVFFVGSAPGIAETAARRLRERIADLDLRTQHGYTDDETVLAAIAEHGSAIVFVGLGNPRQEEWVAQHRDRLPSLVLTCGGLFDWLSGSNPRAPRWMIDAGLEWLWRLRLEPRRLARRYLLGNPAFVASVLRERRTRDAFETAATS